MVGDREPIAALLPEARTAAKAITPHAEGLWTLGRVQQFQAGGVRLTDNDAVRLLIAVESIPIRDRLCEEMTRSTAATHLSLWKDLTRRAPDEVRAAPASMLGLASWLSGNGAMAWCALDQVPQDKPYPLAELVTEAVQSGIHPRAWDDAAFQPTARGMNCAASFDPVRVNPQHGAARPAQGI